MSRGHDFAHCQYCNREYVCGDCINSDCEMGNDRKSCEHFKAYIGQRRAQAHLMEKMFNDPDKKKSGAARMLAGMSWEMVAISLSDSELAEELKIKVWANQNFGTYEIALIEQAIERLNNDKQKTLK